MSIEKAGVKKILFITLSNIGDAVLTSPVLGVLEREFPEASVVVLAGPKAKDIFCADTFVKEVLTYDKRASVLDKLKLILKLRRMEFDMAVDMRHSLFPVFAGAKYMTPLFKVLDRRGHRRASHLKNLELMGIPTKGAFYRIPSSSDDKLHVRLLLDEMGMSPEDKIVAIAAGAKSDIKRWDINGFMDVCAGLSKKPGVKIVLIGDKNDKAINSELAGSIQEDAYDLSGCLNLRELAYLLSLCRLLITNDSAPLHIAGSVDMPVIAIFGPTDPEKYGPVSSKGVVLRKALACSPCEKASCRFNLECMKQISGREVLSAAEQLLSL